MRVSLHYGRPRLTTIRHLYKTVNSSTAVENFFFHKKNIIYLIQFFKELHDRQISTPSGTDTVTVLTTVQSRIS